MIYLPGWYKLNCHWHDRCERFSVERSHQAIHQLTRFFRHQGELTGRWTRKETLHLTEVRGFYDLLMPGSFIAAMILVLVYEKRSLMRYAFINAGVIAAMALILPFFASFWHDVFHPLLFSDELWRNTPRDVSYYIMPGVFFLHSTVLLIIVACLVNLSLGLGLRHSLRSGRGT